jgi:hypothetical protein
LTYCCAQSILFRTQSYLVLCLILLSAHLALSPFERQRYHNFEAVSLFALTLIAGLCVSADYVINLPVGTQVMMCVWFCRVKVIPTTIRILETLRTCCCEGVDAVRGDSSIPPTPDLVGSKGDKQQHAGTGGGAHSPAPSMGSGMHHEGSDGTVVSAISLDTEPNANYVRL